MFEKVISYMKTQTNPVSMHDIARAINEPETEILGVMNVMVKKMMARIEYVPLSAENGNSIYYVLSKMFFNLHRCKKEECIWIKRF